MEKVELRLLANELHELRILSNFLADVTAELHQAKQDLASTNTRLEACEKSLETIQDGLFEHFDMIAKNIIAKKLEDKSL